MATYHLSVKFGGKGKALAHANYITREDKFSQRKDLEHTKHGNMPEWAKMTPPISGRLRMRSNVPTVQRTGKSG